MFRGCVGLFEPVFALSVVFAFCGRGAWFASLVCRLGCWVGQAFYRASGHGPEVQAGHAAVGGIAAAVSFEHSTVYLAVPVHHPQAAPVWPGRRN